MKQTRRILAVILVIAMLAGMGSALALDKYQYTKYRQYMCVGDSIAAGYTYSGSWDNYGFVRVPGAYHDIVANAVDADLLQYACSGFRLIEFRYMMDGVETDPDEFWEQAFGKQYMSPKVLDDNYTDMFRDGIKTSDLMSINLGSNDILTPAVLKAIRDMNSTDNSAETSKTRQAVSDYLDKLASNNKSFGSLLTLARTASSMPPVLRDLVKNLWDYYQLFKQNWEASMKVVYELNPDITVLALSVYNPAYKIYVDANNSINLGPIVQPVIDLINQFLKSGSKYADKYTFVDVDGVDSWGMTMQDPDYFTYFVWSMHPTRAGHTDIANRMLKVLPEHWVDIEFTQQPKDVTVAAGKEATFSVATKFGNTPYYQWYCAAPGSDEWTIIQSSASKLDNNGVAMKDADGKALTNETFNSSAATATLKVTAEKAMDGTRYRCVVKDFYGQRPAITSNAATLTVTGTDPKPTATPAPTATPKPTATPAPTATPKPTATPAPTATPKPTATPAPTATPKPTATPAPTAEPSVPSGNQFTTCVNAPVTLSFRSNQETSYSIVSGNDSALTFKLASKSSIVGGGMSSYAYGYQLSAAKTGSYVIGIKNSATGEVTMYKLTVVEHNWGDWKVTKEATATEDGVETRVCKIDSSHTETRAIKATGTPTPTPTATASPAPSTSPSPTVSPAPSTSPSPTVQPSASPKPVKEFPFKDVPANSWFYPYVYYVWDNGIMEGIAPDTFAPDMSTTRAQFAAVIYRMADKPAVTDAMRAACPFKDLVADWYKDAVIWCYANGVVNGTGPNTFDPDSNITREQMVAMLYRYSGDTMTDTSPAKLFLDSGKISEYAVPAVAWAVHYSIVNGMGDGLFEPQGLSTRAQLAAVLNRYMVMK